MHTFCLFKSRRGSFCYVIYRVARARYARVRARIQRVCMCEGAPGVRVCWGVGPAKVLYSLGVFDHSWALGFATALVHLGECSVGALILGAITY